MARCAAGRLRGFVLGVGVGIAVLGQLPAAVGAEPPATGTPASPVTPAAEPVPAASAETAQRMKALAEDLRCLVCQNQTLADSNAELAVDLRKQIETMIGQGKSDADIKAYMVARYGDFVLYKPPMQANTWLLWLGPFALLVLGGLIWLVVQRRSSGDQSAAAAIGSPVDAAQVRRILDDQ